MSSWIEGRSRRLWAGRHQTMQVGRHQLWQVSGHLVKCAGEECIHLSIPGVGSCG